MIESDIILFDILKISVGIYLEFSHSKLVSDDDAVWMLFLAMEYQKSFYETLPRKISDTTSELLKRVRETADREAANAQNRLIQSVIDQTEKLTARVHIVPLMPIYLLIILCLMAFGSLTYWAGLCAGLGKPLPLEEVLNIPAGILIFGLATTSALFYFGLFLWKLARDDKNCFYPALVTILLTPAIAFCLKAIG